MAATMRPTHPTSLPTYRHHPYHPSGSSSSSSTQPRQPPAGPKWQVHPPNSAPITQSNGIPPSPPRSNREPSESPSNMGLGVAFGGSTGGKWWDEELPAPPASLSSILESFRRSGEGDRDLLLSILGAKKAEEERLTALIQTRLTILQARLSLHSAAASLAKSPAAPMLPTLPTPEPSHATLSPPTLSAERAGSPSYLQTPVVNTAKSSPSSMKSPGYIQLPPMNFSTTPQQLPSIRNVEGYASSSRVRAGSAERKTKSKNGCCPRVEGRGKQEGSTSPRSVASEGSGSGSSRNGLEMLLDAGIETERRASGERERE